MNTIINFAPTGMVASKQMTPYVPLTISEILEDIHRAYELGITIVHLHIRDERMGMPTLSATKYG
ncbi:MAG TPA: 3-keto-5-aminohexanoate cleavage protein, partial [bacterium (Candidatus Stahlbacteria)]|nr:3-keto-5-aminohexanoate cleavage protein [Candidatus Stahlbacteria bacterium]